MCLVPHVTELVLFYRDRFNSFLFIINTIVRRIRPLRSFHPNEQLASIFLSISPTYSPRFILQGIPDTMSFLSLLLCIS